MSGLDTTPRIDDPDGLFEALIEAHHGLDQAASRRLDARLVLLLANHIGRVDIVHEAIAVARAAGRVDNRGDVDRGGGVDKEAT